MAGRRWFLISSFGLVGDLALSPELMLPRLPHLDIARTRQQPAECSKRAHQSLRAIAAVLAREPFRWLGFARRSVRLIPALSEWLPGRCFVAPGTRVYR